jgi:hypothetical protein
VEMRRVEWKELPGSFDLELTERCGLGLIQLMLDDLVDTAAPRPFVQLRPQIAERARLAGHNDLDLAVVGVAHPTAQAKLSRLAMDKPSKADTLDPTANEEVENHRRALVSQTDLPCATRIASCRDSHPPKIG